MCLRSRDKLRCRVEVDAAVSRRSRLILVFAAAGLALLPVLAEAHGNVASPPPTLWRLLTRWEFDPLFIIVVGLSSWIYYALVQRVNRLHAKAPWPRKRTLYFMSGNLVLVLALISPPATYDTDLFSLHMVQHLLITMVAARLFLLGTPVTLALRAATPQVRRNVLLPMLHSRALKIVMFPVVSWIIFAAVMWLSHFSALYEASLTNTWIHRGEHLLYLVAALMFWWQAIGLDPTPWRMPHPVRLIYVFLQLPQSSFLGGPLYHKTKVLYSHYANLGRTWGPSPLFDQQIAWTIMWIMGDMMFLGAMALIGRSWMKHEEMETKRVDRQLARERAEQKAAREAAAGGTG